MTKMAKSFTVEPGTYIVSASYGSFSDSKTVSVKAGDTVTVEFRWYTQVVPATATIVASAYVDDKEVLAVFDIRRVA